MRSAANRVESQRLRECANDIRPRMDTCFRERLIQSGTLTVWFAKFALLEMRPSQFRSLWGIIAPVKGSAKIPATEG